MLESIFDIRLVIAGLAIVGFLCLFAIGGLFVSSPPRAASSADPRRGLPLFRGHGA